MHVYKPEHIGIIKSFPQDIDTCNTHETIFFFTNKITQNLYITQIFTIAIGMKTLYYILIYEEI